MISFKEDGKKFNFRVGAVILSHDKKRVLLHTIKGYDFYLLPGGRVEWLENSTDAIKRELNEELGLNNIVLKPIASYENFFNFMDIDFHEVSNIFVVELNEDNPKLEQQKRFNGTEGEKYIFEWFNIDELNTVTLKPAALKEIIKNIDKPFAFYEMKDNVVELKF